MNKICHFEFYSNDKKGPYIDNLIDFSVDYIHFDGHFLNTNEEFPVRTFMSTYIKDNKSYEDEITRKGYRDNYRMIDKNFYEIDIYKREYIHKHNDIKSEQKIYFNIIKEFKTFDELLHNYHLTLPYEDYIKSTSLVYRRAGE